MREQRRLRRENGTAYLRTIERNYALFYLQTPSKFVRLVQSMRQMEREQLHQLIGSAQKLGASCVKFAQDALPMCGSEKCVQAMVDIINKGVRATKNSLNHVPMHTHAALLRSCRTASSSSGSPRSRSCPRSPPTWSPLWCRSSSAKVRLPSGCGCAVAYAPTTAEDHKRGLLGVSALVHTYCIQHDDCRSNAHVKRLVDELANGLGKDCHMDNKNADDIEHKVFYAPRYRAFNCMHAQSSIRCSCSKRWATSAT